MEANASIFLWGFGIVLHIDKENTYYRLFMTLRLSNDYRLKDKDDEFNQLKTFFMDGYISEKDKLDKLSECEWQFLLFIQNPSDTVKSIIEANLIL